MNYIMRHGPKINAFDNPGADKNGIDVTKTKELLLQTGLMESQKPLKVSGTLRTQLTGVVASELSGASVDTHVALSPYQIGRFCPPGGDEVTSSDFLTSQRQSVSGPVEQVDDAYFVLPFLGSAKLTELIPDAASLPEWDLIKQLTSWGSEQMNPFWSYADLGERASSFMMANRTTENLYISHSGIIEPAIASGLNRSITYVCDFIGETQWGFCEPAQLQYDSAGLSKVVFRGETIGRKK